MNVKTILLAGVPASGKSTIFREVRDILFDIQIPFKYKKLRGIRNENGRIQMLGVFDNSKHEGTDKLSMTVIDDALEYIRNLEPGVKKVVLLEGDRLLNERFIDETKAEVIIIEASKYTLLKRHIERKDNQPETFLKRCETKVRNIQQKYGVTPYRNNTPTDKEYIVKLINDKVIEWITKNT